MGSLPMENRRMFINRHTPATRKARISETFEIPAITELLLQKSAILSANLPNSSLLRFFTSSGLTYMGG